jgi:formylglycine-generating enzyme
MRTLQLQLLLLALPITAASAASSSAAPARADAATTSCVAASRGVRAHSVVIPAGTYRPFFKSDVTKSGSAQGQRAVPKIRVAAFRMDAAPVTRGDYLQFLCQHPAWRASNVKTLFAEDKYLAGWAADLDPGTLPLDQPVTHVSWFAARAYCAARNARLPTVAEWERVAGSSQPSLEVQHTPAAGDANPFRFAMGSPATELRNAGLSFPGVWEWTADFNSVAAGNSSNGTSSLFCGDGFRSNDARDYAAFLRYSFRSSLRGNYTLKNLGFRCVEDSTP